VTEIVWGGVIVFVLAHWLRTEQRLTRIETKLSWIEKLITVKINNNNNRRGAK